MQRARFSFRSENDLFWDRIRWDSPGEASVMNVLPPSRPSASRSLATAFPLHPPAVAAALHAFRTAANCGALKLGRATGLSAPAARRPSRRSRAVAGATVLVGRVALPHARARSRPTARAERRAAFARVLSGGSADGRGRRSPGARWRATVAPPAGDYPQFRARWAHLAGQ